MGVQKGATAMLLSYSLNKPQTGVDVDGRQNIEYFLEKIIHEYLATLPSSKMCLH